MAIKQTGEGGSITVFMTFLFLLLFALTGTVLDHARFFCSGGYMKVSAYGADVAVYGNYNRELFRDYGLFGYGGCDGMGEDDWTEDYEQVLIKNLTERPTEEGQGLEAFFSKKYTSVYQLGAVSVNLDEVKFLSQEEPFMGQLEAWMKTTAVKDISQKLLGGIQGIGDDDRQNILDGLEQTAQMEKMKTEQERQEEKSRGEESQREESRGEESQGEENQKGESQEEETGGDAADGDPSAGIGAAKGENPLEFLRKLVRDGILTLVCDEDSLAEGEVYPRDDEDGDAAVDEEQEGGQEKNWDQRKSASGILKGLFKQPDSLWDGEMLQDQKKKGVLLLYASQMISSYVDQKGRSIPYGLEYMATGKKNQKDAIAAVVNRLFLIRTLLNYAYVSGNPVLQEQSMATATAIAAPLGAEVFIPVLQQCILLILSLEETCVDVTALLAGKLVPILKDQTNFKMGYGEICAAGKELFQNKAETYPKAGEQSALGDFSKGISYVHYLWLFLLMTSWDHLYPCLLDVIQSDLREKYNQSFTLDRCICQTAVTVSYGMPLLSSLFLAEHPENAIDRDKLRRGMVMRQTTVSYRYH